MTTQSATEAMIAYPPNERRDDAVAVSLVIGMGA